MIQTTLDEPWLTPATILIETITEPRAGDPRPIGPRAGGRAPPAEKLAACEDLERFRQTAENLYERVRASLFLHAIYRYEIQDDPAIRATGRSRSTASWT